MGVRRGNNETGPGGEPNAAGNIVKAGRRNEREGENIETGDENNEFAGADNGESRWDIETVRRNIEPGCGNKGFVGSHIEFAGEDNESGGVDNADGRRRASPSVVGFADTNADNRVGRAVTSPVRYSSAMLGATMRTGAPHYWFFTSLLRPATSGDGVISPSGLHWQQAATSQPSAGGRRWV